MKKLILAIIPLVGVGLTACGSGGGTTTNNYYPDDCNAPTFNSTTGQQLLDSWGEGLQTYNANTYGDIGVESSAAFFTMSYYAPEAVLLPTVSFIQREGTQEIYDYFTHFLAKNPVMSLPNLESNVFMQLGCGYGGASGYYNFVVNPGTVNESTVNARFTFVYKYESQTFNESAVIESGPMTGQTVSQTNLPGWYIDTQQSSILPPNP